MGETRQVAVRLDRKIVEGLDDLHASTRIGKTAAITVALTKYLKEHDIDVTSNRPTEKG